MRVLFAVVVVALFGLVAADYDLVPEDPIKNGLVQQATMLQLNTHVGQTEAGDDPDTTGETTIKPVENESGNECKACDPMSGPAPEDSEASTAIRVEEKEINERIDAINLQIEETRKCADKLAAREHKVKELTDRWSLLSDEEKRTILTNKMALEQSSIFHVKQMAEILRRKVTELSDAETSIKEKAALTQTALEEVNKIQPPMKELTNNITDEIVETQLGTELERMHNAMIDSLKASNQRSIDLTGKVDGLHDVQFWNNVTTGTSKDGSKTAEEIAKAMNSPERLKNFQEFMLKQKEHLDNKAKADAAKAGSGDGSLVELVAEKKKLEAAEEEENLKSVIRKLKKKLRRKKKRDY